MYTLGYRFRPWTDPKAIADGPAILNYIRDTVERYGVEEKIRIQPLRPARKLVDHGCAAGPSM
jgi:cation diffusion facilitator CzcD-associated flavoprotein CzcO